MVIVIVIVIVIVALIVIVVLILLILLILLLIIVLIIVLILLVILLLIKLVILIPLVLNASNHKELANLVGVPKALLPVAGKPMLDYWWEYLSQQRTISEIFVVTNALAYKQFERWATGRGVAMDRIVNSGATCAERSRGVLRDVELGLRKAQQSLGASAEGRDLVVFAGDTLFFKDFDLDRILDFHRCKGGSLCLYYGKTESDYIYIIYTYIYTLSLSISLSLYIYIYIYVKYIYIYIYTYVYMYVYIYIYIYIHTVSLSLSLRIHIYIYIYTYIHTFVIV